MLSRVYLNLLLLFILGLPAGCAYEDVEIKSNGLDGQLFAIMDDGSFQELSADLPLAVGAPTSLCIEQQLEYKSGNGLGDTSRRTESILWETKIATVTVTPSSLASIGGYTVDGTCLKVELQANAAGQGMISVDIDSFTDRWTATFK